MKNISNIINICIFLKYYFRQLYIEFYIYYDIYKSMKNKIFNI